MSTQKENETVSLTLSTCDT